MLEPTPQVLAILGRLVEERAGLHYAPANYDLFASRVVPRALDAGFDSLLEYYYFLRYDPAGSGELDALIEALLVHETYFFREPDALRVLADDLVVRVASTGHRARVWCAAAATGEEPLTLAMLLEERGLLGRVELVASDLSDKALERARAGRYGTRAVRSLPRGVLGRWIVEDGPQFVVRRELCDAIEWRRVNLVDAAAVAALGTFDAVLCRNVLIYFDDATTSRVVDGLAAALKPRGRLFVGAAESLLRLGTALLCEEHAGTFFYTRAS